MVNINTQEDFLRVLRENPEWREAVRAQILGEELLHLPAALQELTETVNRFIARQEQYNLNTHTRFDRIEGDLSFWKKDYTQRRMAESAEFIPLDMGIQYERNMTRGELARIALAAAEGRALTDELKSFRGADLVIVATDGDATKYLAVEISYTADQRDTSRAIRNARILQEQTGIPSVAVIASTRNTHEVQAEVDSGQVYWHYVPDHVLEPQ